VASFGRASSEDGCLGSWSDFQTAVIVFGAVVMASVLLLFLYGLAKRDRMSTLRRIRVGFFVERDQMHPEDMPKPEPWPQPPDDAVSHEAETDDWPHKR